MGRKELGGPIAFSSFPVTPSSAPTSDYEVANKKYVNDQVAGAGSGAWSKLLSVTTGSAATTINLTMPTLTGYRVIKIVWSIKLASSSGALTLRVNSVTTSTYYHAASYTSTLTNSTAVNLHDKLTSALALAGEIQLFIPSDETSTVTPGVSNGAASGSAATRYSFLLPARVTTSTVLNFIAPYNIVSGSTFEVWGLT